jgi:hypothetical protein
MQLWAARGGLVHVCMCVVKKWAVDGLELCCWCASWMVAESAIAAGIASCVFGSVLLHV